MIGEGSRKQSLEIGPLGACVEVEAVQLAQPPPLP